MRPAELEAPLCACRTPCCPKERVWSSQHEAITVFPEDLVAESVRELHVMLGSDERISRVRLAGFYLNQCVLTRRLGYFALADLCLDTAIVADVTWASTTDSARDATIRESLKGCGVRFVAADEAFET